MGWMESYQRAAELAEQLGRLGDVTVTRLFGGAALRVNGLPFAFVMGDTLYGRTERREIEEYARQGLEPFRFTKSHGEVVTTSYYTAPADALEEPDRLERWARRALDAAIAAQRRKAPPPRTPGS